MRWASSRVGMAAVVVEQELGVSVPKKNKMVYIISSFLLGAQGESRTLMGLITRQVLSLVRLPFTPPGPYLARTRPTRKGLCSWPYLLHLAPNLDSLATYTNSIAQSSNLVNP